MREEDNSVMYEENKFYRVGKFCNQLFPEISIECMSEVK